MPFLRKQESGHPSPAMPAKDSFLNLIRGSNPGLGKLCNSPVMTCVSCSVDIQTESGHFER